MLLEARIAQPTTEAEAVRLARELYGLAVAAKSLPGEYDDNFHLTALHNVAAAHVATRSREPDGRGVCGDRCAGWIRAAGVAAHVCAGNYAGEGASALTGAFAKPGALSGRNGCGAGGFCACGGAAGIEVGFSAGWMDSRASTTHRRRGAARAGRKIPLTL